MTRVTNIPRLPLRHYNTLCTSIKSFVLLVSLTVSR